MVATTGKAAMVTTDGKSERLLYIDILKVSAILFVILLHSMNEVISNAFFFNTKTWWMCIVLNEFARAGVPLFFMISGYTLLNNPGTLNFAAFYKKRFTRVLIPFLTWDVIYFVYNSLNSGGRIDVPLFFSELFVTGSSYHFWFVYTLIGMYLLMPFLKRIVDNCSFKQLLWFLVIITFTGTIRPFFNTVTPFYIFLFNPLVEGYAGYAILGYILGKFSLSNRVRALIYAAGVAGALTGIIGNRLFSSYEQVNLYFNGGYMINHLLFSAAIFVFAKQKRHIGNVMKNRLFTAVSGVTYAIYLSHVLVLDFMEEHVPLNIPAYSILLNVVCTFIICAAAMVAVSKIKYVNRLFI